MGDAVNELTTVRELFGDGSSHGIDWSKKHVYLIENRWDLEEAMKYIAGCDIIYVDTEGFEPYHKGITLIQVAVSDDCIFLFDVLGCKEAALRIRQLIESEDVIKVFHACGGDVKALGEATGGAISEKKLFDTQDAQKMIESESSNSSTFRKFTQYGLPELYEKLTGKKFPNINVKAQGTNKWLERPMTEPMIKYAAADVMFLPEIFRLQKAQLADFGISTYFIESCKDARIVGECGVCGADDGSSSSGEELYPTASASRGGGQQQAQPSLGTAVAVGVVAVGVGAFASWLLSRERRR